MRTTSHSLGCRHRRKGAQAGGVMTIEQQNQTVGTRAAISAGRTESAQHRRCPSGLSRSAAWEPALSGMMTCRYASLSKSQPQHRFQLNYVYKEITTKDG